MSTQNPIRIANCSGFYGDKLSAAAEQVKGGHIDVLTGDYLAELTMLILFKDKMKDPKGGYAKTFVKQVEEVLALCLEKGIKIVANAGGLNPKGLGEALTELSQKLGLNPKIGVVMGDDVTGKLGAWKKADPPITHLDTGLPLGQAKGMALTANAYLGCWGIVKALELGADIVVTGRVTDAAVVMGPAAWKFGWTPQDHDALAGALVAGHVIECGTQATGGNFAFFEEVPNFHQMGFPIAEIYPDGATVITKHAGTGGLVSVDTVKAQLMYEIQSPAYYSPDAIAHFDTMSIEQEAPDRVKISGIKGSPPSDHLKVGVCLAAGYKNQMRVVIGGEKGPERAAIIEDVFWKLVGGRDAFQESRSDLIRAFHEDPQTPNDNFTYLHLAVRDLDEKKVGRNWANKAVELALAAPGGVTLGSLPEGASACGVFFPILVPREEVQMKVQVGEEILDIPHPPSGQLRADLATPTVPSAAAATGKTKQISLGEVAMARSGDKGGNANIGIWLRKPELYSWLLDTLTEEKIKEWLAPSGFTGEVVRYELPNLFAVNFILKGFLGEGVGASLLTDPQAKCLAEFFRAKKVQIDEGWIT